MSISLINLLDKYLNRIVTFSLSAKKYVSAEASQFSVSLKTLGTQLQTAMQLGSLAVADSKRAKLVVDLDNALEPMDANNRVIFVEHIVKEPELFLKENNVAIDDFSVQSFQCYWNSELFLMRASLAPHLYKPEEFLFHRGRSWAASMLFMLKPSMHFGINEGLIESTALRGICLAIMDDADDAEEDREKLEHTIFTVYPEHAKLMCENILNEIENYVETTEMFFNIENLLGKYRILPCLAGAALISLKEFQNKQKSPPVFHVRKFLQYIIEKDS